MSFHSLLGRASTFKIFVRFTKHHIASSMYKLKLTVEKYRYPITNYWSQDVYWSCPSLYIQGLAMPDSEKVIYIHTCWMNVSKLKMWLSQLTMGHLYNSNPICEPSRGNLYFKHRNLWVYGRLLHPLSSSVVLSTAWEYPSSCVQHTLGQRTRHIFSKTIAVVLKKWILHF